MIGRHGGDRFDNRLVGTENGQEVAMADNLDRPFRRTAQRGLVDLGDHGTPARLAHDARVHHSVEHHVVDKGRSAEHLCGEINPRRVLSDDAIVRDALGRRPPGGMARQDRPLPQATNNRAASSRPRWMIAPSFTASSARE